ncbi:MAG: NADPH-dependent 7-cyano-7-deazaguanine reductase QueF, partial [Chromatiales bacterium]
QIRDDLAELLDPRFLRLTAEFNVRGGIYTSVVAEHSKSGWESELPVDLP